VDLALRRGESIRAGRPALDSPTPSRRSRAAAGFSLIEAMLAALILLVVALGILPLFTRAMASNFSGSESTSLSNLAAGHAEELYQLPFAHADLSVAPGTTERVTDEVWTEGEGRWILAGTEASGDLVLWRRQTRIRQFNINDLLDNNPVPLDGGAPAGSVHVKEIEVEVRSARDGSIALGVARPLRVRLLKAQ
jgi:type II secretory pathway pseudopilin PulG